MSKGMCEEKSNLGKVHENEISPTVQHEGGAIMLWACVTTGNREKALWSIEFKEFVVGKQKESKLIQFAYITFNSFVYNMLLI